MIMRKLSTCVEQSMWPAKPCHVCVRIDRDKKLVKKEVKESIIILKRFSDALAYKLS